MTTTPFEAATSAAHIELSKMVHDPKEIARQVVKAYLEAVTLQLASTGEHATEDFFTFPNRPVYPRVPAVFSACREAQMDEEVMDAVLNEQVSLDYSEFVAELARSTSTRLQVDRGPSSHEIEQNFRTADLLKLIQPDAATEGAADTVVQPSSPTPDEDVVLAVMIDDDAIVWAHSEHEVIAWLYHELVTWDYLESNEVLDLSRTPTAQGLDSFNIIELVMAAEHNFNIDIADAEICQVETLHDLVRTIVKLTGR